MAEIASLLVRIGADANGLVAELGRADKALGKTNDSYAQATKAATAFVTAAAATAAAIAAVVHAATENADAMLKQAQAAGMATASFSELAYAARLNNLESGELSAAFSKLNRGIVEASQGGGAASDAFNSLGIKVRGAGGELKSADQIVDELADKFVKFNDEGPEKAALAIAIFGKAGAQMVPMLNSGSAGLREMREEARALGVSMDTETARAAEKFNDNLTRLGQAGQGLANQLMRELLPAMNYITDSLVAAAKESGSLDTNIKDVAGFIQQSALTVFQTLAVVGSDVAFIFKMISGELQTWGAQLVALATLDFKGFELLGDDWSAQAAQARKDLDDFQARVMGIKLGAKTADGGAMDMGVGLDQVFNKKPKAPELEDGQKLQKDREFLARQLEENADEEVKTASEVAAITSFWRNKQLADEKAINDQRIQAMIEFYDQEQAAAIAQGQALLDADGLAHSFKLEAFTQSLMTQEELENDAYARRLEQLQQFSDAELELLGGMAGAKERLEQDHQNKMLDLGGRGPASLNKLRTNYNKMDLQSAGAFMGQMSLLMNAKSKELFEIGKAAAIGETLINTYKAAMGAYSAMASIPYIGPALGAAAAAAAIVAGMAQVQAIRSQQYGSGSGAAPTFAASPTTGQPASPGGVGDEGGGRRGPTTIVQLHGGEVFSRDQVRGLIEQIAEDTRDGGTVLLAS